VKRISSAAKWLRLACVAPIWAAVWLSGCHRAQPDPDRADWVIRSRLVFLSEDLATERAPLPPAQFRLFFPYIAGDIYGSPTTGDFINPAVGADYRFQIDLNRSHSALLASLEPTQLSLSQLHIEPAGARIARLAPMVLQADGIEPVGLTNWVDGDSRRTLLLLYFDRPATISGRVSGDGRPIRYSIHAAAAGYVWVGQEPGADENVYSVVATPARLLLAVTPPASDRPTAASPARTDTPAQ
jgi:hypothetical protein